MAQLVVRNLEAGVKEKLRRRAARHGHSMEEEIRSILRAAVVRPDRREDRLGTAIAERFAGIGLEREIEEMGGGQVRPAQLSR